MQSPYLAGRFAPRSVSRGLPSVGHVSSPSPPALARSTRSRGGGDATTATAP